MKTIVVGQGARQALLVHGNDLCAEFYLPLAGALAARGFRTTLVTLPGFHREAPLARPGWHPLVDELVAAFPGGTLIGHSLGGLAALLAAARQPAGLERLVLFEPAILPWRWLARLAMRNYVRQVVHGDRTRFSNWSGSYYRIHDEAAFPRSMIELYLECRRSTDPAALLSLFTQMHTLYPLPFHAVRVPSLLLYGRSAGRASGLLAPVLARRMRAELAGIPGAAHWMANEVDDALAARIDAFTARPIR
jgi:pimeloyl-ACP methyl ester carboxylesterase